jgi:hypothetical protein
MNSSTGFGKSRLVNVADLDLAARAIRPWTVGNRILGLDLKLRRMWVGGQRLHHGLTGVAVTTAGLGQLLARRTTANRAVALALLGGVLMAHDWKDRTVWFERGAQSD